MSDPNHSESSGTAVDPSTPAPEQPDAVEAAGAAGAAPQPAVAPPTGPFAPAASTQATPRNTLGLVALILGIVAIVAAVIPFVAFIAWLPALGAVGLGIASLVSKKSPRRAQGLTGLILGGVAFLLAIVMSIVSIGIVASLAEGTSTAPAEESSEAVDEDTADTADGTADAPADEPEPAAAEEGTRETPYAIGDTITVTSWDEPYYDVTVGAPDFAANDVVAAENQFNEPAPAGTSYVLLPVTVVYHGDASAPGEPGVPWIDFSFDFVTATGETIEESYVVIPQPFSDIADLYEGGTGTGNVAFAIPTDQVEGGTWRVSVGWDYEFFYAAQ